MSLNGVKSYRVLLIRVEAPLGTSHLLELGTCPFTTGLASALAQETEITPDPEAMAAPPYHHRSHARSGSQR